VHGNFENGSSVQAVGSSSALIVTSDVSNDGHITVTDGTFSTGGNLTNNNNFNITGTNATAMVAGTFNNNNAFAGVRSSGDKLIADSFINNGGTLLVGPGASVNITNNYTQLGDDPWLDVHGAMTASSVTLIDGHVFGSGGSITGDVNNIGATVTSYEGIPNILTINGNYTQGSGGILEAFLAGTAPGDGYSQLDIIGGTATLDGTLDVDLVPGSGVVITPGESFDLVTVTGCGDADCILGSFASVLGLPRLPSGDSWLLSYTGNSVVLTLEGPADYYIPTPEPSPFLLLVVGIAAMSILLRYRSSVRIAGM
jgi:hypothetical protein